jgi:hypothetical protein
VIGEGKQPSYYVNDCLEEDLQIGGLRSSSARSLRPSNSGKKLREQSASRSKIKEVTNLSSKPPRGSQMKPPKGVSDAYKEMSKNEMIQIIESYKKEIGHLQDKVKDLEQENDQMVDNFKMSSSVLLERLKDLQQF